jgi:hypothetical protein
MPDTFKDVPTREVPVRVPVMTLVLTMFARFDVPEILRLVPKIPIPISVPVETLVLTMFARFYVPDMFSDPPI